MGLTTFQWGGSVLYIETQGTLTSKLDADGCGGGSQGYWTLGDVMKVRTLISFQFVIVSLLTFITSHFVVTGKYPDSFTVA
jgi:hypothetical protein